jgi:DNA invertase Pin-like site-specific DNA recombinase
VLGYVRVSQVNGREGERFISPGEQRQAIERFVQARGHELVDVLIDLDESGGTFKRPMFERALERLADGEADGIAVAKLDRFARLTMEGLALAQRLRDDGHALLFADLDLDTSTPTGKAMLAVALAFAQLELDNRREGWAVAQRNALRRNVYPGTTPTGYTRDSEGRMIIDPVSGPAIRRAFEARACGMSWAKIARQLDDELPRADGRPWRAATIGSMLDSPAYLGRLERRVAGELIVVENAHEPLVSRGLFEAVQTPAGVKGPKHRETPALLAGLARCGSCGSVLTRGGERKVRGGKVYVYDYLICAQRCAQTVRVSTMALNRHVLGQLLERLRSSGHVDATVRNGQDVQEIEAALEEAEHERSVFIATVKALVDPEALAEGVRVRQQAVDELQRQLAQAVAAERARGPAHVDLASEIVRYLDGAGDALDDGRLGVLLRTPLRSVTVSKAERAGSVGDLDQRVRLAWADEDAAHDAAELVGKPARKRPAVAA